MRREKTDREGVGGGGISLARTGESKESAALYGKRVFRKRARMREKGKVRSTRRQINKGKKCFQKFPISSRSKSGEDRSPMNEYRKGEVRQPASGIKSKGRNDEIGGSERIRTKKNQKKNQFYEKGSEEGKGGRT